MKNLKPFIEISERDFNKLRKFLRKRIPILAGDIIELKNTEGKIVLHIEINKNGNK